MGHRSATRRSAPTGRSFTEGTSAALETSQQHISRLESPGYEGHSLTNLRRVAEHQRARPCGIRTR